MTVLTELEKKPAFIQFIKACKAKMNLGNYLILPVQRLPRYEILLEGLKRYTSEEHVDYPNIIAALDKVHTHTHTHTHTRTTHSTAQHTAHTTQVHRTTGGWLMVLTPPIVINHNRPQVKELNSHVDKKKKDEDNRRAIQEIQKAVSGAPTLFVAHRQFIRYAANAALSHLPRRFAHRSATRQSPSSPITHYPLPITTLVVVIVNACRGGLVDVLAGKKKEKFYVYLFTDILLLTKAQVWGGGDRRRGRNHVQSPGGLVDSMGPFKYARPTCVLWRQPETNVDCALRPP